MRIVILPQAPQRAPLCLTVDKDGTAAWRRLHPGEDAGTGWTALVVPGIEAVARWLHLPTRNTAQALAAARLQWENAAALGNEALHLAVGPLEADGHRLVVAVARERLQAWLEEAKAHGVEPDLVIPDHLALPEPADGEVLTARMPDGAVIARGPRLAFACEDEMLPALLGGRPARSADPAMAARLMAEGLRTPAVNLLQGAFADRRTAWHRDRRVWRVAILAGLLLASPVLLRLGEGAWLSLAAARIGAETRAAAAAVAPGPDPIAALAEQVRRRDLAAGGGAAGRIAHLAAALEQSADVQLEGLRVTAEGDVAAAVRHASPAELEALTAALRGKGVTVSVDGSRPDAGRTVSDLRLGGAL